MNRKQIVVLVGPKGAGKSSIGELLATGLGVHFLRVEPLFLEVRDRIGASHPDFEKQGFEAVFACLERALGRHPVVCFESTGASAHFPALLERLRPLARILPVRVHATPAQCLDRVKTRDLSIHIPVSDERVEEVNAVARTVALPWAAEIDNSGAFQGGQVKATLRALLASEEARDV